MIVSAQEAEALAGWAILLTIRITEILERAEHGTLITPAFIAESPECEGMFNPEQEMGETAKKLISMVLSTLSDFCQHLVEYKEGAFVITRNLQ